MHKSLTKRIISLSIFWIILAVVVSENQRLKDRVLALEKNSPNPKQRDIGP